MHRTNIYYYIYILIYKYKGCRIGILLLFCTSVLFGQDVQDIQIANEYVLKGEKQKAAELYKDLAKKQSNIPLIHNNYINVLLDLSSYQEAGDYLKQLLKREPSSVQYKLDLGIVYMRSGEEQRADKYFKALVDENKANVQAVKLIADYLSARSMSQYSVLALTESRKFLGNPYLFSLDLAMLYRIQGEKDKMVQEYLSYVTQSSANIQYVKNVMQALLSEPEDLESLERLLYDRVQQYPDVEVYSDLLIWVTMQEKNFYASFIQARAYDKRYNKEGDKCMEVAKVALDNKDYSSAARVYRYVSKEYPESPNYLVARLGLIRTRETEIRNIYPVQQDSVKTLIQDYDEFIKQYPDNTYSLEAERSEALLYAMYLGRMTEAIEILKKLIDNPKATLHLKSKAKLDLGDIYLLKEEPWESTLLYSQVEKAQRENTLGYDAKLKNAKLSYYKGNFKLAQEHLDILKEATTREIANDAMDLSMRIKENTAYDSTGAALKEYASVELMLYQNKTNEALEKLQLLGGKNRQVWLTKEEAFEKNLNPAKAIKEQDGKFLFELKGGINDTSILDDVYWLEANIRMKQGEFDKSIALLQKITENYPDDILADDAFFLQGDIYERQLKDKEKAMEIYREFLNRFPGSVYAAEARRRFRTLRGDFTGQSQEFN